MEENSNTCADSNTNTTNCSNGSSSGRNQTTDHLHLLNKTSHKISKSHHHHHLNHTSHNNTTTNNQQQQQQQQPPVYNIDKSDFRQLVQKLTSSPSPPPPPTNPSSRLHRIRPPPLAHVTNACPPPPLLNDAGVDGRSRSPFSPLPPFPTVSIAAESPISAYLRYLRSSAATSADADPRRSNNPSSLQPMSSSSAAASPFLLPATSPLAFGHIPHLSPSSQLLGFQSLPLSPGLPVPSPRWKDM
ncbi:VQ motif-containing protein 9 [Cinnamomum micranthum f. kanehirae]|uniref:VQ motif-containing protein 9 n=1 Tax=Cinnamomum micranthum f. kanehirae TaxID=337451 RepID=A0A3S3MWZ4_9MAGN|nr:VQ motif-containing protein 9 [Cinnamomum micranthum f. kanehirae]